MEIGIIRKVYCILSSSAVKFHSLGVILVQFGLILLLNLHQICIGSMESHTF